MYTWYGVSGFTKALDAAGAIKDIIEGATAASVGIAVDKVTNSVAGNLVGKAPVADSEVLVGKIGAITARGLVDKVPASTVLDNFVKRASDAGVNELIKRVYPPKTRAFNANHYVAEDSMTWTVESADVQALNYQDIGKLFMLQFNLVNTQIAGVASNELRMLIPGGYTATDQARTLVEIVQNQTPVVGVAYVLPATYPTYVHFKKLDGSNFDMGGLHIRGQMFFPADQL